MPSLSNPSGRADVEQSEPVEIALIAIPVLAEAIAVVFSIGVAIILTGIWSGAI